MGFMDNYGVSGPTTGNSISGGMNVGAMFGQQGLQYQPSYMPGMTSAEPGMWDSMKQWGQQTGSKIGGVLGSEGFQSGMGAFNTLASMYTGFKALGLAKDQLNFQKKSFNQNFNAQAQSYNNALKDRWAARNASAQTRGRAMPGMDQWMSGRQIETVGKG
jgi:hypothetical protein